MQYYNPTQIERQRALSGALAQQPRDKSTGVLGGLAHMLRNYGAYKGGMATNEMEASNQDLQKEDLNQLIEVLKSPGRSVQGMGGEEIGAIPAKKGNFQTPEIQSMYAQALLGQQTAKQQAERLLTPEQEAQQMRMQEPPKPSAFQEQLQLLTDDPELYSRFYNSRRPVTNVNTTVTGDDSASPLDGYTETLLGNYGNAAASAPERKQQSEYALNLLKDRIVNGNETGKWAPLKTNAAAWLGVDEENVATAQLFDVAMGDKVMGRIQETKGAVSEKEMDYFAHISPGSDKTPFTNYVLLEIDRRAAAREQDKMNYVKEYMSQNGDLVGFDQWYLKNHDPFPEFDVNEMRKEFNTWSQSGNATDLEKAMSEYN